MKVVWNFIKGTFISIWAVIAIFATICLMSYNDYGVSEFGDYSLFIVDNKSLEPTFKKYDLVIVEKDLESAYDVGDEVFFYNGNNDIRSYINEGQVTEVERLNGVEDNFSFGDVTISYGNLIGSANGAKVFKKVGLVLDVIESRWGFMFFVILPTIYAVVYEIYTIVLEVKKETKKELKKDEKDED